MESHESGPENEESGCCPAGLVWKEGQGGRLSHVGLIGRVNAVADRHGKGGGIWNLVKGKTRWGKILAQLRLKCAMITREWERRWKSKNGPGRRESRCGKHGGGERRGGRNIPCIKGPMSPWTE